MNCLLINSPLFREPTKAEEEDYLPSLGLGIIANSCRANNLNVDYIDAIFERRSIDDLIVTINEGNYCSVGMNIFTVNVHLVQEIVERVKAKTKFIIGGLSTRSLLPKIHEWKTQNDLHVVFGDGEKIFPMIANETIDFSSFRSKNVFYYEVNQNSPFYVSNIGDFVPDRTLFKNEPFLNVHGKVEACIVTSRGCIYNCAFCAAARSLNRDLTIRISSPEAISSEITNILKSEPSIQSIRVLDDLYLKDKISFNHAIQTFSAFPIEWRAMAHVGSIKMMSDEDLINLKRSGCSELFIGVESGSKEVLKSIHKISDVSKIEIQINRLFASQINVKAYFIYGFPNETEEQMGHTLKLAENLANLAHRNGAKFRTSVFQFRPYHGTQLYHEIFGSNANHSIAEATLDQKMSSRVGRAQFNFTSGNYSNVEDNVIRDYIAATLALSMV